MLLLANTAYESLTRPDKTKLRGSPVGEFFRHVRHAASHDNKWNFLGREPEQHAEWQGIVLDKSMNNATLVYGTLHPADLLYLLRDVEALLK